MSSKGRAEGRDGSPAGARPGRAEAPAAAARDTSPVPAGAVQRARTEPRALTPRDGLHLQRTLGNRTMAGIFASLEAAHAPPAVQRQPITREAAEQARRERAPAFAGQGHVIDVPWGEEGGSNCHGYTVHGEVDRFVEGSGLLAQLGEDAAAAVFVEDGVVAHSGRLNADGTLTHLLVGVGVVTSEIGGSSMGYAGRFDLPEQRAQLQEYLQPEVDRQNAENQLQEMVTVVGRALARGLEGAEALSERVYFLQDEPDTGERDAIVAEYQQFVEANPGVLQALEGDYGGYGSDDD